MKNCPQCHQEFEGRSNKIYCSDECKMEAFKRRQEAILADAGNNSSNSSSASRIVKDRTNGINSKIISKELELKKHELDLEHQLKLLEFEQKQKELKQREKELLLLKKKEAQKLALVKAKKEQMLEQKKLEKENKKAFAPIQKAVHEIFSEIIENGRQSTWPILEVEELIEDIQETISLLKEFYYNKTSSYHDSFVYIALKELESELKEVLEDESYYESDDEVLIDFKKSYIRELKSVLEQLGNGWKTD